MSKKVSINQETFTPNNDLNLHKLLAFASLPATASLSINPCKDVSTKVPQSPQIAASSSIRATGSKSAARSEQAIHWQPFHDESLSLSVTPVLPTSTQIRQYSTGDRSPQMIASNDVYKMAPAPVFMTPSNSVYPQVALIPETDLLRSMIVKDVKQVTQKLFDKHSKKKRGRRRVKEEIIPGDYGTLKINFSKFVDIKHPPFSLDDPPAPKRTVYQRIAPYPVATTESNKMAEKPPKKAKATSARAMKRQENSRGEATPGSCLVNDISNVVSSSPSTARPKRSPCGPRRSRQKEARRSLELPITAMSQTNCLGTNVTSNLSSELAFIRDFQSEVINVSSNGPSMNHTTSSSPTHFDAGRSLGIESRPSFTNDAQANQRNLSLVKEASIFDGNSNCIKASPGFPLTNSDSSPAPFSDLLDSSTTLDNPAPNLGSPGVIGKELTTLLSELYNDFPPLSPATAEENMDLVVPSEVSRQSTTTVSVLSQPVTSHISGQRVAVMRKSPVQHEVCVDSSDQLCDSESKNAIVPGLENEAVSLEQINTDCSETASHHVVRYTTEVLGDSSWPIQDQQMSFIATSQCASSQGKDAEEMAPVNESLFTMDVDVNQSEEVENLLDVVDISPEYASTEGGGKIILIGSWNNKNARYSCKFGNVCTPGDLIQNGVLRCFCPPHSPGKVEVSVLCDGVIISKSVHLEYVDTEDLDDDIQEERHDWLKIKDEDLKSLLVERIEALIDIFDVSNTLPRFQGIVCNSIDVEDALVNICESISKMQDHLPSNIEYKSVNVMTVLHLSAALGFTKLIQVLCSWVETNNNRIIQQEADPCKFDQFHLTPLIWACAKGKFDSVCVLIQWDEASVGLSDGCGCTPLSISRDEGHSILVRYLEKSQSKGSMSKNSSFATDSGSPKLRSRNLSRSSSLSSQIEGGREMQCGNDDSMLIEASRKSPGSNRTSQDGSPDTSNGYMLLSRTLGQTLVHVQAIIQDGVAAHDENTRTPLTSLDLDDDNLFAPSPFTPRSNDDRLGNHTPKSLASLSPASSAHSPACQSPFDPTLKDTAEFCEFFYNSDRILEKDFAELTLTDEEQQNLYKAASVIQNAYKRYRERRKQRDVELSAAVLIQSYYRRYKEYAMFKRMQRGAVVIQHKYRAHREMKKQKSQAASVIQSYYRRYKERKSQPGIEDRSEGNAPAQENPNAATAQQVDRANASQE